LVDNYKNVPVVSSVSRDFSLKNSAGSIAVDI